MMTLTDSVEIAVEPPVIFEWFRNIETNYRSWHPDHVGWAPVAGAFKEGALCIVEEYIHGKLHRMKAVYTKILNDRTIEYEFRLPMSLICPGGSFEIRPASGRSVFTARLYFRGGRLASRLFRSRMEAVKAHMREEGQNLKRILESGKVREPSAG